MNPHVKAKWVEALRSGEFKQAQDALKSSRGKYCCLGVLCELHRRETGGTWEVTPHGPEYMGVEDTPPWAVITWAGLKEPNPEIAPGLRAAHANDGDMAMRIRKHTFQEIAALIEANL